MTRPADQIVALDPAATYEAEEVALIVFHIAPRTFRRRLKQLAAESFPKPISQWGTKVWSGQALIDWQNRDRRGADIIPISGLLARRARQAARKGSRRTPQPA